MAVTCICFGSILWQQLWSGWSMVLGQVSGQSMQECWNERPNDLLWALWSCWSHWTGNESYLCCCLLQVGQCCQGGKKPSQTHTYTDVLPAGLHSNSHTPACRLTLHWTNWAQTTYCLMVHACICDPQQPTNLSTWLSRMLLPCQKTLMGVCQESWIEVQALV